MAVRTRKFNSTTVDANGNLHANGVGSTGPGRSADTVRYDAAKNVVTSAASPAAGMAASNSNVMGSPNIYPGSLHGQSANNPTTVTQYVNGAVPGGRTSSSYKTMLESYENTGKPSYSMSERVRDYQDRLAELEEQDIPEYQMSDRVKGYQQKLDEKENSEKPTWESKYEPAIQSILDGILNRKAYDINTDQNYQQLYNQYAQQYMAQGNRAMRDQLGASAALTGGYGSTAAQAAASQAYDNYLQGLNGQNAALMQLAYGMYQDEMADRYNQLNAVTGLDNTDYGRYRDDVSDWFNDRNYWADRYNSEYAQDYGQHRDTVSDFLANRDYFANRYQNEYANDYNAYRDDVSDYMNDRDYLANMYATEHGFETEADNTKYARYQDAANLAIEYAKKGLPVPSYIAKQITDYTGAADISDVIAAMPTTKGGSGGSGGGGGRRGRSGGGSSKKESVYKSGGWMPYSDELSKSQRYENEVISKAEKMSSDYDKFNYIANLAETNKLTWVQAETILKRLGITQTPRQAADAVIDQINSQPVTFLKKASLKW